MQTGLTASKEPVEDCKYLIFTQTGSTASKEPAVKIVTTSSLLKPVHAEMASHTEFASFILTLPNPFDPMLMPMNLSLMLHEAARWLEPCEYREI